jgi:hypothetical protein
VNTKEQCFVMRFSVGKEFAGNDIHKEMFPVY